MVRHLIRAAVYMGAAAIGLLIASLVLDGVSIDWVSFVLVVLLFGVLQAVLTPLFGEVTDTIAPALGGAVGLITTFAALAVTAILADGLTIDGAMTWIWATLIVWLGTLAAAYALPMIFLKDAVEDRRN